MKKSFLILILLLSSILLAQTMLHNGKKVHNHDQMGDDNGQKLSKKALMEVISYGLPPFDNPNYSYVSVKTAPTNVWYRQAGLSPDGQKIVAQKSYTDSAISRVEVVLMNADGSGEAIISPGNSGVGDIVKYGNPFWSDDGLVIGYVEEHAANPNKVVKYVLATPSSSYIYEPVASLDVNNADFLGSSTTSIIFWDRDGGGFADLFTWDGTTRTNITNSVDYKEYEPVSNSDGTKILYWSGETGIEPINTTHTLTYSGVWTKDVGFTPIVDSYWGYWSNRADNYIGVTTGIVYSGGNYAGTTDVKIYNSSGVFVKDLTGPGYSGGAGQWNFLGSGFEGPNGEILMTSNAGRTTAGRDIVFAFPSPTLLSPANYAVGQSVLPTLSWAGLSGAAYNFEIYDNSSFSGSPIASYSGVSTSYSFAYTSTASTVLNNNANYYWRVRQTIADVTSGWAQREFITVTAATPIISSLTASGTSVSITWYTSPYMTGLKYDLLYSTNSNMSGYLTVSDLTNTYYTLSGLAANTTYYVQIRSKNSAGNVIYSYSSVATFTTPILPVPIPLYPISGVTVYSTTPTAYWSLGSYFTGLQYRVRYATTSGGLSGATPSAWSSNLYYTFSPALTAGQTYYWQVESTNDAGVHTSGWSSYESFVVYSSTPATPPVPYPSWPVGGATSYFNPPTLYWYHWQYATGLEFKVEWDNDSNLSSPSGNSGWISNLYYTLGSSLPSGTTYWHVKSRLASGDSSSYSSIVSFVIPASSSGSAPVPTPYYPAGGITVWTLSPTLGWYAYSTSSLEYQINYSPYPDADGSGVLNHATVVTLPSTTTWQSASTLSLSGLTAGTTYYWQVRSRIASPVSSPSAWSTIVSFTTAAGVSSVVPLVGSPNFGQPINSSSAVLTWILPTQSQSHLKYDLQYSVNADMNNSTTISDLNENQYQIANLQPGKYYWRVLSKTNKGEKSRYSAVGNFKTNSSVTAVEEEVIPTSFELSQNYPNPFNPTTRIRYALPQNAFVSIRVYDMLGREVRSLVNNEMAAGSHSVEWSGDDNAGNRVSSGAYIYRITATAQAGQAGNFISTKKMIMLK